MITAMIIDDQDNVAVAIEEIKAGDDVTYVTKSGEVTIKALEDVTIYHKIATTDIKKGEPIVKYGEHIGIAGCDIKVGGYVHVHNVESHREDLEAK